MAGSGNAAVISGLRKIAGDGGHNSTRPTSILTVAQQCCQVYIVTVAVARSSQTSQSPWPSHALCKLATRYSFRVATVGASSISARSAVGFRMNGPTTPGNYFHVE